ncbi:MAG: response regulator, partial [Oligoflexales bacterium]|nr:response regulator [Oligoflexales bacterium]
MNQSLHDIRILVVDDDAEFLEIVVESLEKEGFAVESATNGDLVLSAIKAKNIDIVVTDIRMPGKNGLSLLMEIKQIYPFVPVIMITG